MSQTEQGVQIVVSKAFGPKGDNLVGVSDVTFDGFPALSILLRTEDGREGIVHLSPIHGDSRKTGFTDIKPGTRLSLVCPISGLPLERVEDIDDAYGAGYYALYRTMDLSKGAMIMISDIWGHYHSRVIDDFELIAAWAELDSHLGS